MDRSLSAARLAALVGRAPLRAPAYRGLAEALRLLVLDGLLVQDMRLPSERDASRALGLSRTTVAAAYALLRESDLLAARRGAGNYVTVSSPAVASVLLPAAGPTQDGAIGLLCASSEAPPGIGAAYARALQSLPALLAGTGYFPDGLPRLRERLAGWFTERGLPTDPAQLVITSGALSALNVVARAVLRAGDRTLLESPTYSNAVTALDRAGGRPLGLPVSGDADEVDTAGLEQLLRQARPRLAYLIPDFHNPTGRLMSCADRERVAASLRRSRTLPVVDETLVELDLDELPRPAPFGTFAPGTITIGSASKAFWGGLRIGWIRAPHALVGRLVDARATIDLGAAPVEQVVLAEVLQDATELLADQRLRLRARRDALRAALTATLPAWSANRPAGGLSLWVQLPEPIARVLAVAAEGRGVLVTPGTRFHVDSGGERHLRLPFTAPEHLLTEAVRRLALAEEDVRAGVPLPARPALELSA